MSDAEDKYAHLFPEDEPRKEREKQNRTRRFTMPTLNTPWVLFDLKKFYAGESAVSKAIIDFGIPPATDQKYKCVSRINMNRLTEIVGEYYHEDSIATAHSRVSGNKGWATLRPDTDNKHDDYAVSVHIEGRKVGFIPTDLARRMQRRLILLQEHQQERVCCPAVFYESNDRSVMQVGLYANIVSIIHDGIRVPRPTQKPISLPSAGFIIILFMIFGFLYLIGSCSTSSTPTAPVTADAPNSVVSNSTVAPVATEVSTAVKEAGAMIDLAIKAGLIVRWDGTNKVLYVNQIQWNQKDVQLKKGLLFSVATYVTGKSDGYISFEVHDSRSDRLLASYSPWSGTDLNP